MGRVEGDVPRERSPDRLIDRLAAAQDGCVTRAQLIGLGVSLDAIRVRIERGQLQTRHRGVYCVGRAQDDLRTELRAALLATGPYSAVSHRAAGVQWGFIDGSAPVEISAPRSRTRLAKVTVHRPRSLAADVREHRGFRVTTPARTLVDLCAVLSASHVARLFQEAEVLRLVTRAELGEVLDRSHGRRGIRKLKRFALVEAPVTRSQLEARFLELAASGGLPAPRTNESLLIAGRWFELDAHWPDQRVAVELDGWEFHGTRERFESDRERDAAFAAAGWSPVRFTWRRLSGDPARVVSELRVLLGVG